MVGMEIVGLYVVMAAAIIGGLLLLWFMLAELVHFDASRYRVRSARIPDAARPSAPSAGGLVGLYLAPTKQAAAGPPRSQVIRGVVH